VDTLCASIIPDTALPVILQLSGQHYKLSKELNEIIEEYGDITD